MNCEGWSSGATKLGWVGQIEQPTAAARWVSGLGMLYAIGSQGRVLRLLGSKRWVSLAWAWAVASQCQWWRHGMGPWEWDT